MQIKVEIAAAVATEAHLERTEDRVANQNLKSKKIIYLKISYPLIELSCWMIWISKILKIIAAHLKN